MTPYQKQVLKIKAFLNEKGLIECRVGTIEELQGLEKSIIIVSMVRSIEDNLKHDLKYNLGFIHSYKRFNCAVSRAKAFLIVIGNPFILSRDDNCWAKFIYNCIEKNCYYGCQFRIKSENPLEERLRAKLMGPKP